jgi:hypothetical protein
MRVRRKLAVSETNAAAPVLEAQPMVIVLDVQRIRISGERLVCFDLVDGLQARAEEACEACDADAQSRGFHGACC